MTIQARIRIGLRRRDMDELGHLNQSVYHELLEEGRAALFTSLGGSIGAAYVLVHVDLDYVHEVRHSDGYVEVEARIGAVGRTSVTVEHDILLPSGEPAARGKSVLVAWDVEKRGKRELTAGEREALGVSPPG